MPGTLFEKIWDAHVVDASPDAPSVVYIDLHLIHEVTSPQAFTVLRERGLRVRRPDRTVATIDHSIPTHNRSLPIADPEARHQISELEKNCKEHGIRLYGPDNENHGVVHVIGPELGLTRPGMTIVCGDSHTSTHGAFGALAFGIGTSEVGYVLASQCVLQRKPRTCEVRVTGKLAPGVSAKDVILAIIAKIGAAGGTGYVFEYTGDVVRAMSMEERMTLCNMSIEGGARAGLVQPDEKTFEYLKGRQEAPKGAAWDAAVEHWKTLRSDEGATYDRQVTLDGSALEPMITYGTSPDMGAAVTGHVPDPNGNPAVERALGYMGLKPGEPLAGLPVDVVFVGSCTNSRLSDLEAAARVLQGRKVDPRVRMLVVPGSRQVKRAAERQGLDQIFRDAGAEWREPGCSMCIAMNGDEIRAGQYAVSTSNRNFEGRQGRGGRTFLASPQTAAASAVRGRITDPRELV